MKKKVSLSSMSRASFSTVLHFAKPPTPIMPVEHYTELPLDYEPSKLVDSQEIEKVIKGLPSSSPVKRMERKKGAVKVDLKQTKHSKHGSAMKAYTAPPTGLCLHEVLYEEVGAESEYTPR